MKESFYRIKMRGTPMFYDGYTNKLVRSENPKFNYYYLVEDEIKWHTDRFWSCLRLNTAEHHMYLIKRLTGLKFSQLVLQRVQVGKVEEIVIKEADNGCKN